MSKRQIKTYAIEVVVTTYLTTELEIKASSKTEAKQIAVDKVRSGEPPNDFGSHQENDVTVVSVKEVK